MDNQPEQVPEELATGPGCEMARLMLLSLEQLEGLAQDPANLAKLRQGFEYMEKGARAAQSLGQTDLAREMEEVAQNIGSTRTHQQAAELAERLAPLKESAEALAEQCQALGVWDTDAVTHLAERVVEGELSFQDAKDMMLEPLEEDHGTG